jgi:hypothetical protein
VVTPNETIADPEGTELPSLEADTSGHDISTRHIHITNVVGPVLLVVPFSDAFTREVD